MSKEKKKPVSQSEEDKKFPLPVYDDKDDIFSRGKEERLTEDGESFEEDLDVPGSELDDAGEKIGEEDEENNYYSLGGDNHEAAEEDNTDVVEEQDGANEDNK